MRLVPEYEPVRKLYLSFVQAFFNSRFGYGKTICEIINAVHPYVDIELLIAPTDRVYFEEECTQIHISLEVVALNYDSPGRGVLAEYVPIFAQGDDGNGAGLVFRHPKLDDAAGLEQFSRRFVAGLGFRAVDMRFEFSTAHLSVNEDVVFLSDREFRGEDRGDKLRFFADHFPDQSFHVVPGLAGDTTSDLDMYLWPIAPKVWIVSEYPAHTPQAASTAPALQVLRYHGHAVHRVPGLEPIIYDDINTMPNYANGVIVNGAALVPAYQRKEDEVVVDILEDYGYEVFPIDCSQVILSNSAIHCISKTVPADLSSCLDRSTERIA